MGIDTGREAMGGLGKLQKLDTEIWYSRFAILESLWMADRLVRVGKLDEVVFEQGLQSIVTGGTYLAANGGPEVFMEAFELWKMGHMDMIDDILYATSASLGVRFLTVDSKLRGSLRSRKLKDILLLPDES